MNSGLQALIHQTMLRYNDWRLEREHLSEQDVTPYPPSSSQWENSDDAAVDLLDEAMHLLSLVMTEPDDPDYVREASHG